MTWRRNRIWLALAASLLVLAACGSNAGNSNVGQTFTTTTSGGGGSTTAGVGTPDACPSGSTNISAGQSFSPSGNTNYCFAAGTYTGFDVTPQSGDGFYGQGNATLNGNGSAANAFITSSTLSNVTIDGFTMTNYKSCTTSPVGNCDQVPGIIEFQNGNNVTVTNNLLENSNSSGVSWGNATGVPCCVDYTAGTNHSTIAHNTVANLGYSGLTVSGSTGDTISYNDVSATDTDGVNTEITVAAVGKFAIDDDTTVIGNNIHNNNDTAMWFDDYNVNSIIENNYVGPNNRVGIFYEISTNAMIENNTLTLNGQQDAGHGTGAPGAAIRISSSGSSSNQPEQGGGATDGYVGIMISGNTLTYNHEGVTLFDGHQNTNGSDIYVNSVTVTNNSTIGDNSSYATDSDAWMAHDSPTGHGNTWTNNTYTGGSTSEPLNYYFSPNSGPTNYAGWHSDGADTSGSSCQNANGGSC